MLLQKSASPSPSFSYEGLNKTTVPEMPGTNLCCVFYFKVYSNICSDGMNPFLSPHLSIRKLKKRHLIAIFVPITFLCQFTSCIILCDWLMHATWLHGLQGYHWLFLGTLLLKKSKSCCRGAVVIATKEYQFSSSSFELAFLLYILVSF